MIFPNGFRSCATLGIVAPSSPFKKYSLEEIENALKNLGYRVKFGKSCYGSYKGYLSNEDAIRAKDIEDMFLDDEVDAIFCIRGGYGTPRILNLINYEIIKNNPKPFIGFSDITALHTAFNQKCNLVTFHGIMAGTSPDWDEFSYKSLLEALSLKEELVIKNPCDLPMNTLVGGKASGKITGGNLALLVSTLGSEYEIDTKDKILFIEDIGENIYRLDRMLTSLDLAGKFKDCAGIIFGDFCDCTKSNEDDFELEELFLDIVAKYNKPCISNLKSGHCTPMVTLPLGAHCELDATNKIIKLSVV